HGSSNLFTIPFALRLTGALDIAALSKSFETLIARHEILRTAFRAERGEPWQEVLPPQPFPLPVTDLTGQSAGEGAGEAPGEDQAGRLARALDVVFAEPLDLARPPLLRARLFRVGPEEHV